MTNYIVIDASLTLRFIVPTQEHKTLRRLFAQWQIDDVTLIAPTLWAYEVTSTLNRLVYSGDLTEKEAQKMLTMAAALAVELVFPDDELRQQAFLWTRRLNRVAAYDSFYLALAERLDAPFWTVDQRLSRAANQPWINVV